MNRLPVAIIGAGPAGLAGARALKRLGIDYVQFERFRDVGGIWDIDNPGTPMYRSAHFISSRDTSGFFGFPMPKDYPDYPSRQQILAYTRSFAEAFGLREPIQFNTAVQRVEKDEDGNWSVHTAAGATRARAVICATGTTWDAKLPQLPGHFDGEIMHSVNYFEPSIFVGKRVLIVGLGNSGADIACDAATTAEQTFISVRRGYHFVPKHTFGMPSDQTEFLPIWAERALYKLVKAVMIGDVRRWGLPKPDHKLFETHPLLNTQLLHHLQHGDVIAKGDVARFDGHEVVFRDGSREQIDLVVFATGFNMSIPYLPEQYLPFTNGRPQLALNAFSREHDNLFGLGYVEVNSSAYTLFDHIANLIAHYLNDQANRPQQAAKFRDYLQQDFDLTGGVKFVASDRHTGYVEVRAFKKALKAAAKAMGWPSLKRGMFNSLHRKAHDGS